MNIESIDKLYKIGLLYPTMIENGGYVFEEDRDGEGRFDRDVSRHSHHTKDKIKNA